MLKKDKSPLSLDTPWAISEAGYEKILRILLNREINKMIEFGSGVSTVRFGLDFPNAHIVSVEHDPLFYQQTVDFLQQYHLDNVIVLYCALSRLQIGFRTYLSYNLAVENLDYDIDFILIDGPVESITLRGREAPLYLVFPNLKVGGIVALDDYHRGSSKIVVKNWLNSYHGALKIIHETDRLVFLRKCNSQANPGFPGIASYIDNLCVNMKLKGRALKQRFLST